MKFKEQQKPSSNKNDRKYVKSLESLKKIQANCYEYKSVLYVLKGRPKDRNENSKMVSDGRNIETTNVIDIFFKEN